MAMLRDVLVDGDRLHLAHDYVVREGAELAECGDECIADMPAHGSVIGLHRHRRGSLITEVRARSCTNGTSRRPGWRDHLIAHCDTRDVLADGDDRARTFVTTHHRQRGKDVTGHRVTIGMADPGCSDPDEYLSGRWSAEIHIFHLPGTAILPEHLGLNLHLFRPPRIGPARPQQDRVYEIS
jgi:hypothetical protein